MPEPSNKPVPRITKGDLVLYILTDADVAAIQVRRGSGNFQGAPLSVGGGSFPGVITFVEGTDDPSPLVNIHVFLDGNDSLWVTEVIESTGDRPAPGSWRRQ